MKVQKKMADCGNVMPDHGLRLLAILLAAMTLLLLVAGALVTSNEAGDSVPDWPLSFGRWLIQSSNFVANVRLFAPRHRRYGRPDHGNTCDPCVDERAPALDSNTGANLFRRRSHAGAAWRNPCLVSA